MQLALAEATDAETFLARPEQPDVEEVVAEDGTVFTFTRGSPREIWIFRDFSVILPQWLAKLCSGQCVCCGKGSLWYMYQGWGTVATRISLVHRTSRMELVVHAKFCGWCRREARRVTYGRNPNLVAAPVWDQPAFDRLARFEEISRVATGLDLFFPSALYKATHIWIHQTNRYADYTELERFNYE